MLDRRLLMVQAGGTPPGGGIVQDGLTLWLDGKDKGGKENKWVDKALGVEFNLVGCKLTANSVVFDGSKNSYAFSDEAPFYSSDGTLQIAVRGPHWRNNIVLFSTPTNGITLMQEWPPPSKKAVSRQFGFETRILDDQNHTFSTSRTLGYNNAVPCSLIGGSNTPPPKGETVIIGQGVWNGSPADFFRGEIYALRYYDRILSESEILQNQQYDIDTYFGGVIPE